MGPENVPEINEIIIWGDFITNLFVSLLLLITLYSGSGMAASEFHLELSLLAMNVSQVALQV